jgi:hypothetical protein
MFPADPVGSQIPLACHIQCRIPEFAEWFAIHGRDAIGPDAVTQLAFICIPPDGKPRGDLVYPGGLFADRHVHVNLGRWFYFSGDC